ncbi:PAS domain-containing protein [Hymenobacter humi]|uniref:histidine kinase n=1 Tax=Hymenobacter humi TaxID=1411620 RepID=A0ABW2UAY0_9BACT
MAGAKFVANVEGVTGASATGAATVQLAVMDVSALNAEVERRKRSEERLDLALAASNTGVWVWAFATNALEWDERAQACFGRPHDPNPTSFAVLQAAVYAPDVLPLQRALQAAIKRDQPLDIEFRVQWPDGTVHYLGAHGKVRSMPSASPSALSGWCTT